jgi:tRNA-dihydrouridine synthase
MRSAASIVAKAGADVIDINMGCPVRKFCKTGAGAALIEDPDLAVRIAAGARDGGGRPVTVKLRSGLRPGGREGFDLALRLAEDAGVAAVAFHPRSAATQHKGNPDYALTRELVERTEVPVIVSGGLDTAEAARRAYTESGADAVMIARGSLGNPWIFEELTGRRSDAPDREDVIAELLWVMDRAEEHLGRERAAATCASSTRGTWSDSTPTRPPRRPSRAPTTSTRPGLCRRSHPCARRGLMRSPAG